MFSEMSDLISVGDTAIVAGRIGRAVIKDRGTRVALHGAKPQVAAKMVKSRLTARGPGHSIKWTGPSQRHHRPPSDETDGTNIVLATDEAASPDLHNL